MKKLFITCAAALVVLGFANSALASLVFTTDVQISGTGLGAVDTLVTVHDPGGPGNQNGTESGCINQDGSFTNCTNGVEGGDNTAINQVLLLPNDVNFAAVVNISETGQDKTVTLTNLYLTFCAGAGNCYTATASGLPKDLTQGTGLGNSGFVFALDAAQFAIVHALSGLNGFVTVSGGLQFANGTTNDGNDTLFVIRIQGNTVVPEPATLTLFGIGLSSAGFLTRRRMKK